MSEETKPFRQLNSKDYEVQINGRTQLISIPFGATEEIFKAFISNGGIINPDTGEVQQDIISLMGSFKDVGNLLLHERDENGKITKEGNCSNLDVQEVIALFQLATFVIENFTKSLANLSPKSQTPEPEKSE